MIRLYALTVEAILDILFSTGNSVLVHRQLHRNTATSTLVVLYYGTGIVPDILYSQYCVSTLCCTTVQLFYLTY